MKGSRIRVIKIDELNRVYLYPKKVLYKQKKNGRWITKVSAPYLSSLLESDLVSDDIKKKLVKILEKSNHFFNRG